MSDSAELVRKFWAALKSDRTFMLGLVDAGDRRAQPMTGLLDGDSEHGPIYIFTAKSVDLVRDLGQSGPALAHFASKGHDVFASIEGVLSRVDDRALIDRLWSPYVAAWYKGGKDDPDLQLLRFDPGHGQIWLNESGLFAGLKLLLGVDPKEDYKDKKTDVQM